MKWGRIVFWQVNPSPHLSAFMRSLSVLRPSLSVIAVFQQNPSGSRLALGWDEIEFGSVQTIMAPNPRAVDELVNGSDAIHVFSGMSYNDSIRRALEACIEGPGLVGMLSEGRNSIGLLGKARVLDSFRRERRYRSKIDFVLAIGCVGVNWYKRCGYADEMTFPFGYVVDPVDFDKIRVKAEPSGHKKNDTVQILYIGQLIKRKRVDLLIDGLTELGSQNWRLTIVGDGEERSIIKNCIRDARLTDCVVLKGQKKNETIWDFFANADLLVLPSQFDGWGAVVNEALMMGVPVICSSACGASDLIQPGINGDIFKCGSVPSLVLVLEKWIGTGRLRDVERKQIQEWSKCIEGKTVARYFFDIVDFVGGEISNRPVPPWMAK